MRCSLLELSSAVFLLMLSTLYTSTFAQLTLSEFNNSTTVTNVTSLAAPTAVAGNITAPAGLWSTITVSSTVSNRTHLVTPNLPASTVVIPSEQSQSDSAKSSSTFPTASTALTSNGLTDGADSIDSQLGTPMTTSSTFNLIGPVPTGSSTAPELLSGITAPSTTSTTDSHSDLPLMTYTIYPSISISEVPSLTVDGHIETTGSDHHATPVPVFGPRCFFCPPGLNVGLALFGLVPGIYPPGPPPLPPFKNPFPAITIGNNGDPTYPSPSRTSPDPQPPKTDISDTSRLSSTEKTPSTCTQTMTASFCAQVVAFELDSLGSTTSTSTSNKCSTTVGCTVRDSVTTSTTISSKISCPTFAALTFQTTADSQDEDNLMQESDVTPLLRRHLEPATESTLAKRAGPGKTFSPQQWSSQNNDRPICILPNIKTPAVPRIEALQKIDESAKWFITEPHSEGCGPWKVLQHPEPWASQAPRRDAFGKLYIGTSAIVSPETQAYLNVDHAFETKFLFDFFIAILLRYPPDSPECESLKNFWNKENAATREEIRTMKTGDPHWQKVGRSNTRVQSIFKLLAGVTSSWFADYAGTDVGLNAMKGDLFLTDGLNADFLRQKWMVKGLKSTGPLPDWIDVLNYMAGAMTLIHNNNVAQLFRNTNIRLYLAFRTLNNVNSPCPPEDYAASFKGYMIGRLTDQRIRISGLYQDIKINQLKVALLEGEMKAKWERFNQVYDAAHFDLDVNKLLDWDPSPTKIEEQSVQMMRREDSTARCAPQLSTSSSASLSTTAAAPVPPLVTQTSEAILPSSIVSGESSETVLTNTSVPPPQSVPTPGNPSSPVEASTISDSAPSVAKPSSSASQPSSVAQPPSRPSSAVETSSAVKPSVTAPSTSSPSKQSSASMTPTSSPSSRRQTRPTTSRSSTWPPPKPTYSPRPGALSPNCRDGSWEGQELCESKCEKGRCDNHDGNRYWHCDCVAPLPPAPPAPPAQKPECALHNYGARESECLESCGGKGACTLRAPFDAPQRSGWWCVCPGDWVGRVFVTNSSDFTIGPEQ